MCAGLPGPDLVGKHRAGLVPIAIGISFVSFLCVSGGVPWTRQRKKGSKDFYIHALSFACAKESAKEKHTGNDVQPLPDAVIKLQYYC